MNESLSLWDKTSYKFNPVKTEYFRILWKYVDQSVMELKETIGQCRH